MKQRTPLIAGNWKMHKTIAEALELVKTLHYSLQYSETEIVVAPPCTALSKVADFLKDSFISVAAQDVFWEDSGAFTGAVSAPLLKEAGADYVIIGHSERRQYFHETNATVNKKTKAALKHQLIPIVCVGETLTERENGRVNEVITTQISEGLSELNNDAISKVIIAYEPVWAIGTGKNATPAQAEAVHVMIRTLIAELFNTIIADKMRILYGGSVKASNSKELLALENIDGALVGGASLKADDFIGIIKSC
jgi:triosephosphate isomerase (TIM)